MEDNIALTTAATNGQAPPNLATDQAEPDKKWKPDDDELAVAIAQKCNHMAYFWEGWHIYESGFWQKRDDKEIEQEVRISLREYRPRGVSVSDQRITSVTKMLIRDLRIPTRDVKRGEEGQTPYINFPNGLYNIDTHSLEPHRKDLYFTAQMDYPYDPDADLSHFLRFLNTSLVKEDQQTTDHEMISLVQEAIGYSLSALTDRKAAFMLMGVKDSGKSTLIKLLSALAGDLARAVNLNDLATDRYILATILGKRIVTCTEGDTNSILPDGIFKMLTGGGDRIQANVKYKDPIEFTPVAKLWWGMNTPPRTKDRSGATLRRMNVILFNRSFGTNEQNRNLDSQLIRERAGIFNWAMNGLFRLQHRGSIIVPEQSAKWLEEYDLMNDTERTFLLEMCEQDPEAKTQGQSLYSAYALWCRDNGNTPKNSNIVASDWRRLGLTDTRVNGRTIWHGVRLRNP